MRLLTQHELTRIEFLYRIGVSDDEIIDDINARRAPDEEDSTAEVDYYIQCILEGGD